YSYSDKSGSDSDPEQGISAGFTQAGVAAQPLIINELYAHTVAVAARDHALLEAGINPYDGNSAHSELWHRRCAPLPTTQGHPSVYVPPGCKATPAELADIQAALTASLADTRASWAPTAGSVGSGVTPTIPPRDLAAFQYAMARGFVPVLPQPSVGRAGSDPTPVSAATSLPAASVPPSLAPTSAHVPAAPTAPELRYTIPAIADPVHRRRRAAAVTPADPPPTASASYRPPIPQREPRASAASAGELGRRAVPLRGSAGSPRPTFDTGDTNDGCPPLADDSSSDEEEDPRASHRRSNAATSSAHGSHPSSSRPHSREGPEGDGYSYPTEFVNPMELLARTGIHLLALTPATAEQQAHFVGAEMVVDNITEEERPVPYVTAGSRGGIHLTAPSILFGHNANEAFWPTSLVLPLPTSTHPYVLTYPTDSAPSPPSPVPCVSAPSTKWKAPSTDRSSESEEATSPPRAHRHKSKSTKHSRHEGKGRRHKRRSHSSSSSSSDSSS
ncbi:hypothetical protein B484DRAFT_407931, partial [Ochromonadaceae sp. CCMP2298]